MYFCHVQQDILHLYEKARVQSLEAPEVAWLENQAREHPYYTLVYMVLARHHMSNKSTIKNRALQKGAVYALDRGMLKRYLYDVIPVTRPVVRPKVQLQKAPVAPEKKEAAPEPVAETPTVSEKIATAAAEVIAEAKDTIEPVVAPEINAYIDMRVKLRMDKYKGATEDLRKDIASFGKAPANGKPKAKAKKKATKPKKVAAEAVTETEAATPDSKKTRKTAAKKKATTQPRSAARKKVAPAPVQEDPARKPNAEPASVAPDSPEYEIGAFSSFTFLEDADTPEQGESEIDSPMLLSEAVEIQTSDAAGTGHGEIIFEEKERIIEVTVTPEEMEKYFKGRLPVELNFSAPETAEKTAAEEKKTTDFSIDVAEVVEVSTPRKSADKEKESELIEKFIEVEPSISRVSDYKAPVGDLSTSGNEADDEWVTETLAKIYAQQGNKQRARQIYQKLALVFPEKSDYFADLIAKLK